MFRIRKVIDDLNPSDQVAIREVQAIIRRQFSGIAEEDVEDLPAKLRDPMKDRLRSILLVAEDARGGVRGFALLQHAPDLKFCYLDLISAAPGRRGGGIGSALYQHLREEARALHATGLFFECLPDDPALSLDPAVRKENSGRLAFYERYGARPLANTAYETPLQPGGDNPPYLVFDDLGTEKPLRRKPTRAIVRAILERKYGGICPESYVAMVEGSIVDDPVRLRDFRYRRPARDIATGDPSAPHHERKIVLVVNDRHTIHHVRERGYVEAPVRVSSILEQILPTGLFLRQPARHHAERYITAVHARDFVTYLRRASAMVPEGSSIYPYTFPIRNQATPPKELPLRAGYYCIDTFTPINNSAYKAAVGAVDCTLTCAEALLAGERLAYALVRPPGHHAETRSFGGFCYFNSAAVAAQFLVQHGPVAMLDLDYHHGNGQEEIFYGREDVLTVSIHGPPRTTYPYFSGFKQDRGSGAGQGFNANLPLPEQVPFATFLRTLQRALRRIVRYRPRFVIVCLGLDTARGDPTGSWEFTAQDFLRMGRIVGTLRQPILVVQEGGYRTRSLGVNARNFFVGLHEAYHGLAKPAKVAAKRAARSRTAARPRTRAQAQP